MSDLSVNGTNCPPCYAAAEGVCEAGEMCWEYGNPGFGFHGFDNLIMSWLTIFIGE